MNGKKKNKKTSYHLLLSTSGGQLYTAETVKEK